MADILVLCTANRCRSVMAQALMARRLAAAGITDSVGSAGLLQEGNSPPIEVISVMAGYGIDVAAHRSAVVTVKALTDAHLILGMARGHVRHAVVAAPQAWPRAFTLKELVRRGEQIGRSLPGEPLTSWLARIHDGRDRLALLGDSPADDVADPIGGPQFAYAAMAMQLDALVGRFVELRTGGTSAIVNLDPLRQNHHH